MAGPLHEFDCQSLAGARRVRATDDKAAFTQRLRDVADYIERRSVTGALGVNPKLLLERMYPRLVEHAPDCRTCLHPGQGDAVALADLYATE